MKANLTLQVMVQRFYEHRATLALIGIKNANYVGEYVFWKLYRGRWLGGPTRSIDIEGSRKGDIQVKQRRLPEDGRYETRSHCKDVVRHRFDQLGLILFNAD